MPNLEEQTLHDLLPIFTTRSHDTNSSSGTILCLALASGLILCAASDSRSKDGLVDRLIDMR